mgnify:CR=1 FL=1
MIIKISFINTSLDRAISDATVDIFCQYRFFSLKIDESCKTSGSPCTSNDSTNRTLKATSILEIIEKIKADNS